MDSNSIAALSAMLVGVLTPAAIAFVNHPYWTPAKKRIVAYVCAGILGLLTVVGNTVWTSWQPTLPNILTLVLAVIGAAQVSYGLIWKPTGAADVIETTLNPGTTAAQVVGRHEQGYVGQ